MHGFWTDIFWRWVEIFENFVKKWRFWLGIPGAIALAVLSQYGPAWESIKDKWHVVVVPLVLSALYALKHAIERHYGELESEHATQGDELTKVREEKKGLERELQAAKQPPRGKRPSKYLKELLALQEKGLDLKRRLPTTWSVQTSNLIAKWAQSVGRFLKEEYPDFHSQFFVTRQPPTVTSGPQKWSRDVNRLNAYLQNLQDIINEVRRAEYSAS